MKTTPKKEKKSNAEEEWARHQVGVICRYLNNLDLSDPRNLDKINDAYIRIVRGPIG
jgi:hypothetical protein